MAETYADFHAMSPDAWIAETARHLRELLPDPMIDSADLHLVAIDLAEDRRFNTLPPAAAAAQHVRETA